MSGADNLRGIDYQVAYSLLTSLHVIRGDIEHVTSIKFESLTEDEEDFNLFFEDGTSHFIQIKKRDEGYPWTPSDLRDLFHKFSEKDSDCVSKFSFVTNGTGNTDVVDLKKIISGEKSPSKDILLKFKPTLLSFSDFKRLINKVELFTRFLPSSDDSRPAKLIAEKIMDALKTYPFEFTGSVARLYESLWKTVFDLSRTSAQIDRAELVKAFATSGLSVAPKPWAALPTAKLYINREDSEDFIRRFIDGNRPIHLIHGLSGIGKTSLASDLARRIVRLGKPVLWCSVHKLMTPSDLRTLLVSFMSFHGEQRRSAELLNASVSELGAAFSKCFGVDGFYFFFDGINNASGDLKTLLTDAFGSLPAKETFGKVLLTSTDADVLPSSPTLGFEAPEIYKLGALKISECDELLKAHGISLEIGELNELVDSVAGHPLSITLYCQFVIHDGDNRDFAELSIKTVEAAQTHILNRTIQQLSNEHRNTVLRLSVIPYSFSPDWIDGYLTTGDSTKLALIWLEQRSLLTYDGKEYTVHDLIRSTCLAILSSKEVSRYHSDLAGLLGMHLTQKYGDQILYEDGFRWAYHLEKSAGAGFISGIPQRLLALDDNELEALWAIDRYGYPFDHVSEDLSYSESLVAKLVDNGMVIPCMDQSDEPNERLYRTNHLTDDALDHTFLVYLNISRGISGHMGYIDKSEPNYAFEEQVHVVCVWEHRIELMPLPPLTKEQVASHIEFLRSQFAAGAYEDKSQEQRALLAARIEAGVPEDIPDTPDEEMEAARCPIFGHCCPGGPSQASACSTQL